MHLKNFSLYQPDKNVRLTPAYDLLNVAIANPADNEQLALTLNGKKRKIQDSDFQAAFETCGVPVKVFFNLKKKYAQLLPAFRQTIETSFLDDELQTAYKRLLDERINVL